MATITNRQIPSYVSRRAAFRANSVEGKTVTYRPTCGRLSDETDRKLLSAVFDAGTPVYVVSSYGTPIAWHSERTGWHVVEQKFSVTTSRHTGLVRQGIA